MSCDSYLKVLLVLDHAPDYREKFLRQLGLQCSLTVLAQSCEKDSLMAPVERIGYEYIECQSIRFKSFRWFSGFYRLLHKDNWDVICVAFNPHHPWRFVPFLLSSKLRNKWIWWGQIYGRSKSKILTKIRKKLLSKSKGALVYSQSIQRILNKELPFLPVLSFNNSQASRSDYEKIPFRSRNDCGLRFLFVGRPQNRKRLHVLIEIAKKFPDISIRLVGPGMIEFVKKICNELPRNVECYAEASGHLLRSHFEWCDLVANPGHLGLLAVNSACHCRGILVEKKVVHAPEVILAKEASQLFIDFDDYDEVGLIIEKLTKNSEIIENYGLSLYQNGKDRYSIENMVIAHLDIFNKILS